MKEWWFYILDDEQLGPVSAEDLSQLAASGTIKPSDRVWKVGTSSWTYAGTMKTLFQGHPEAYGKPGKAQVPHGRKASRRKSKGRFSREGKTIQANSPSGDSPSPASSRTWMSSGFGRLGKFAGNHRFLVGSLLACCLPLIIGIINSLLKYKKPQAIVQPLAGAIISLPADKRGEYGFSAPDNARALFESNTIGDFIQAIMIVESNERQHEMIFVNYDHEMNKKERESVWKNLDVVHPVRLDIAERKIKRHIWNQLCGAFDREETIRCRTGRRGKEIDKVRLTRTLGDGEIQVDANQAAYALNREEGRDNSTESAGQGQGDYYIFSTIYFTNTAFLKKHRLFKNAPAFGSNLNWAYSRQAGG
jgi:hypothetical protein